MYTLGLEKAEEPEINLLTLLDHRESKGIPEKHLLLLFVKSSQTTTLPSCISFSIMDIGNLISGFSAFSKSSLYIWNFLVHILLRPSLKDFEHYLLACEMSIIVW